MHQHHTATPMDIADLRAPALKRAGADLRNAAHVAFHAGRSVGDLVDRYSGGVCIVGAIEAATYQEIYTNESGEHYLLTREEWIDEGLTGCDTAILIMAQIVSGQLCAFCPTAYNPDAQPWEIVTHFSDNHCTGPVSAERMLLIGAAYAEALAGGTRSAPIIPPPRRYFPDRVRVTA